MHIIDNEDIYPCDVDKTLVSKRYFTRKDPCQLEIWNPYTNRYNYVYRLEANIDLLKEMYGRKRLIWVWSAGGVFWAQAVIQALELEKYVSVVSTKPKAYIDDKPVSEWMTERIFLTDEDRT